MLLSPASALAGFITFTAVRSSGPPDFFAGFLSAAAVSFYAEVLARLQKSTVTTYLLIGIIPMVPGAGIYHTMEYCIQGDTALFISEGLHTLGMAGALAIGILVVDSTWRMIRLVQRRRS